MLALPALMVDSVDSAVFGSRSSPSITTGSALASRGGAFGLEKSITTKLPRGGSTEEEDAAPVEAESLYLPGLMETAIKRSKKVG